MKALMILAALLPAVARAAAPCSDSSNPGCREAWIVANLPRPSPVPAGHIDRSAIDGQLSLAKAWEGLETIARNRIIAAEAALKTTPKDHDVLAELLSAQKHFAEARRQKYEKRNKAIEIAIQAYGLTPRI